MARQYAGSGERRIAEAPVALERVLAYQNEAILNRFIIDHDATPEVAQLAFDDLKRWLWLCAEARRETMAGLDVPPMTIFEGQVDVDDMWHTFLLFTRDYAEFCFNHFGFYLHHVPTTEREKLDYMTSADEVERGAAVDRKQKRLRANAAYVFEKLGEDVARRWFLEPPRNAHAGPEGVPAHSFHTAYEGLAPWETGMPQPAIRSALGSDHVHGSVLDIGCGTGDNAFAFASHGHAVVGVDLVPKAIEQARTKQKRAGIDGVEFHVADLLEMDLRRTFDTIVDSGVFHAFSDADRERYVESLLRHLAPGGHVHILCFSDVQGGYGPRRVSRSELEQLFGAAPFEIESLRAASYATRSGPKPAWHLVAKRG